MPKNRKSGKASSKEKSWKPILDVKPGHNLIGQGFKAEEVSSIWEAAGLELRMPDGLLGDLSGARACYSVALHRQQKPTARQLERHAKRIASLSFKLLDTLLIGDQLRSGLGAGGLWAMAAREGNHSPNGAVKKACDGVSALGRWATVMSKDEAAKSKAELENKKKKAAEWKCQFEEWKIKHAKWEQMSQKSNASNKELEGTEPVAPVKPTGNADKALNALFGELEELYYRHSGRIPGLSRDPKTGVPGGPYFDFVSKTLEVMGLIMTKEAVYLRIKRHGQMTIIKNPG